MQGRLTSFFSRAQRCVGRASALPGAAISGKPGRVMPPALVALHGASHGLASLMTWRIKSAMIGPCHVWRLSAPLRSRPSTGDDWLHEPKWDGFRFEVIKDGSDARLYQARPRMIAQRACHYHGWLVPYVLGSDFAAGLAGISKRGPWRKG